MSAPLSSCSVLEQQVVIFFLGEGGKKALKRLKFIAECYGNIVNNGT
jgi:hypothetical protein